MGQTCKCPLVANGGHPLAGTNEMNAIMISLLTVWAYLLVTPLPMPQAIAVVGGLIVARAISLAVVALTSRD